GRGAHYHHLPCARCPDPAPDAIYPLSLHDALPIYRRSIARRMCSRLKVSTSPPTTPATVPISPISVPCTTNTCITPPGVRPSVRDRKSTRLNSSHVKISYAVFCLKKKRKNKSQAYH